MIENNYFYFINNKKEINILEYILFYSIITIQKSLNLIIFHNLELNGKYYDNLINNIFGKDYNTNIRFIKIDSDINKFIPKYINEYGGIYIKKNFLILRPINKFLIYDYIMLDNILVGIKKNSNINDIYDIPNIFRIDVSLIDRLDNNQLLNNIYDYNFNKYFEIVYNKYFLVVDSIDYDIIYKKMINSDITILNLFIYYVLGFNFYFKDKNEIIYEQYKSKLDLIDKIYYINLKDSTDRNNVMVDLLNKFGKNFERYDGINGKEIQDIKNIYFENKKVENDNSNSEYAVLYSHLSLLKKIEEDEGDYFLIFEDDMCLDFIEYWNLSIKDIIENAPDDWDILMLGYFTMNLKFNSNYRKWNNDWSALSYIIKKSSIKKINKYINENNKFTLFNDVNVADNYIFRVFNTYVYKYPLFTIKNNNKSTFHNDHDNYQKIYKNINLLILNNIIEKFI